MGENLQIYLLTFLADQRGQNMRNVICHGLARPEQMNKGLATQTLHAMLALALVRKRSQPRRRPKQKTRAPRTRPPSKTPRPRQTVLQAMARDNPHQRNRTNNHQNNRWSNSMEPYRKRRWRKQSSLEHLAFFTCARPGRSQRGSTQPVPDSIVQQWVTRLPGPRTTIISLGHKPDRTSEFSFDSFHGKDDTARESRGKQPFQAWLEQHHPGITVIEHPTTDFPPHP